MPRQTSRGKVRRPELVFAVACLLFVVATYTIVPSFIRARVTVPSSAVQPGNISEDQLGLLHDVVYFEDPVVNSRLGCPPTHGCFYLFNTNSGELRPEELELSDTHNCAKVVQNCFKYGECFKRRDWCLRSGRLPDWLSQQYPSGWREEKRITYLAGRPDTSNPTHVTCLHMLPLLKWIQRYHMSPKEILLMWDIERAEGPGKYGEGLAQVLGGMGFLPELNDPVIFRNLKLGEYGLGRFPYHLLKHELDTEEVPELQQLASLVKQSLRLREGYPARPKVVIAVRTHTRILSNAEELRTRLLAEDLEALTVDFATMDFNSQVKVLHDAACLVTVHGADAMNMMFLPKRGVLVEIAPVHYAYGFRKVLRKGDYYNLSRMLGIYHLEFVNTKNSTIITREDGGPVDWNDVNSVKEVPVDVDGLLPVVKAAVMMACGSCYQPCGPVNGKGEEQCIPEAPKGRTVDWSTVGYYWKVKKEGSFRN